MATRVTLFGDKDSAVNLRKSALNQLEILRQQMLRQNLKQGERVLKFDDGTVIQCTSVFGFEQVNIYVPKVEDLTKKYNVQVELTVTSPYYVEVTDPDFTDVMTQNGHIFYIVMPDFEKRYFDYVVQSVIASPGTPQEEIVIAIRSKLAQIGVVVVGNGDFTLGVKRISVTDIQKMFPPDVYFPNGSAYNARTTFREAKSFIVGGADGTEYIGYTPGILRYKGQLNTENIFDQYGSEIKYRRKYHQFQIIGSYFVWFGMQHKHEVGYPDWVNLNVKVCKNISGIFTQLYEFTKFDYLGILGYTGSPPTFCTGPDPGNILGFFRPPAYFDHIANVQDNRITIIAKGEHGLGSICGGHDYEDYGCGSGCHIEMQFDGNGIQISGERTFNFSCRIAGTSESQLTGPATSCIVPSPSVGNLEEDDYSVDQTTEVSIGTVVLRNYRGIENKYYENVISGEGIAIDRGWILESDAKITDRWRPRQLGSNGFSLNYLNQCSYRKILRRYEPVQVYGSHVGLAQRYCSATWEIWNSCDCRADVYPLRSADGGPGNLVSGSYVSYPAPDWWTGDECTFGREIADRYTLDVDHTGTSCGWFSLCRDYYCQPHEKTYVCVEDTHPGIANTNVAFSVDMNDLSSPHMSIDIVYGINPPADANEMEDRLRGPEDIDWDTVNPNPNIALINDTNGAVEKVWAEPHAEQPDKTVVYFGNYYKEYPRIWQGNKVFWEMYNYAYAFLDNRAIDDTALLFIGTGAEDPGDPNYDVLTDWTIEYIVGSTHRDIKALLFEALDITLPTELLDMGMI